MAQMTTVHTLLADTDTTVCHWPLYQMDLKNAFLHGYLSEVLYMTPSSYGTPSTHVCRLHRAIYGLEHAPHAWFECFLWAVLGQAFWRAPGSLFVCVAYLVWKDPVALCVDDMIITCDETRVKHHLQQQF